jgi:AcrR family transcriptional regulator
MTERLSVFSNYDNKIKVVYAMSELMETIPFEKLTIAEICEAAGLSRATFYRYFDDKYSVAQWHCDYVSEKGSNQIGRTLSWHQGYYASEARFAEMDEFYRNVGKTGNYNALDVYALRARETALIETITEYYHVKMTSKLLFQVEAVVNCEVSMLPRWHYGKVDATLEEVCDWMVSMVPDNLFEMLNTPIEPHAIHFDPSDGPIHLDKRQQPPHRHHSS